MRITLGQLRRLLAEAYQEGDTVVLDFLDVYGCLDPQHKTATRQFNKVDVPFRYADNPTPAVKELGMTSKDALATLKRDVDLPDGRTVKTTSAVADKIVGRMARVIAGRQAKSKVDFIVHAASGAGMTKSLALAVGDELGVEVVNDAFVRKDVHELEAEEKRITAWAKARAKKKGDFVTAQELVDLQNNLAEYIAQVRLVGAVEAKKIPHLWRQFFNLHKPGPGIARLAGKRVLVIDDNLDKGWTFVGIADELQRAGVDPQNIFYAAGYDYADRS